MKKQKNVSRAQQVVFGVIIGVFIAGIAQVVQLLLAVAVYGVIPEWYIWYGIGQIVPILIFGAYYIFVRGDVWTRLCEASMLSVATLLFSSSVMSLVFQFLWPAIWLYFSTAGSMFILNAAAPILEVIVAAVLIVLIRQRSKSASKSKLFGRISLVVASLAFFAISLLETVVQASMQYPDNQNLSAYIASFVGMGGIVIVSAVLYYLERKRGAKSSWKSAVFMTAIITMALYVAVYFVSLIPNVFSAQSVVAVIITIGCVGGLFAFRWLYRTLRVLQ